MDIHPKAYEDFPTGSQDGKRIRWHKQFEGYLDALEETQSVELPDPYVEYHP